MIKKRRSLSKLLLTYKLGRFCEYCGNPLADQLRANRRHCEPQVDEYGRIYDCKRRKHQKIHQNDDEVLQKWCALQKNLKRKIESVLEDHGSTVTLEILAAYKIQVSFNIRFKEDSEKYVMGFLGYDILYNKFSKQCKILKNEQSGLYFDIGKSA